MPFNSLRLPLYGFVASNYVFGQHLGNRIGEDSRLDRELNPSCPDCQFYSTALLSCVRDSVSSNQKQISQYWHINRHRSHTLNQGHSNASSRPSAFRFNSLSVPHCQSTDWLFITHSFRFVYIAWRQMVFCDAGSLSQSIQFIQLTKTSPRAEVHYRYDGAAAKSYHNAITLQAILSACGVVIPPISVETIHYIWGIWCYTPQGIIKIESYIYDAVIIQQIGIQLSKRQLVLGSARTCVKFPNGVIQKI